MTIGERVRSIRKSKNLTQKQLGELSGIAEPTIRRYELGKLNPKYETLAKIAKALAVSTEFLYYGFDVDREHEELIDTLHSVGLEIECTGFMDNYYLWHTDAENIEADRVEIEYPKLKKVVFDANKSAEYRRIDYLRSRLDLELFR